MTPCAKPRLLVLAVDGLDWDLLHRLVDAGQMPFVTQLMKAGASGPMRVPAPAGACAQWTTLATGTCADEHGVLDDLWVRPDGIRSSRVGGAQRRRPTFWELAAAQGRTARVVAWPAATGAADGLLGASPEAASLLQVVGEGFERAEHASETCWPLSPDCVEPPDLRALVELVDEARVHPEDLAVSLVQPLVPTARPGEANALLRPARWQLARWSSVHNLGVHWASQGDDALMVLRLDGLPEWLGLLRRHAPEQPADVGLAPWYRYLDLLVGRYMALLGRQAHLMLLSNAGIPAAPIGSGELFRGDGPGGLVLAGPDVPADILLERVSGLDVAPTLAGLLGLVDQPGWPGRDLLARQAGPFDARRQHKALPAAPALRMDDLISPVQRDEACLDWLRSQGCPVAPVEHLERNTLPLRMRRLAAWVSVRRARGDAAGAIAALQVVLREVPQELGARVTLGELLLEAGRFSECDELALGLPPQAHEGLWADVVQALLGFAARDWLRATLHLQRLVAAGAAPLNAPSCLGRVHLRQQQWGEALAWFDQALTWPGDVARVHEGRGLACQGLGRPTEAEQAYSRAIAEQPDDARPHLLRAQARLAGGHLDHAESGCRRALTLDSSVPGGYALLAQITLARAAQPSDPSRDPAQLVSNSDPC